MARYLLLLGMPGAGKGTQAERLSQSLELPRISSGDLFREHQEKETDLGKLARDYLSRGDLVPDDVTISMIKDRLGRRDAADGAILDGFPRTPAQARALDEMMAEIGEQLEAVLYVSVSEATLIRRLAARLMCRAEGHTYHEEFNPPQRPGVCDIDGSELYQRDDDREEAVVNRIRVYFEQTAPLIEYYRKRGVLHEVDGEQPIASVTKALLASLPQHAHR